MNSTNENLLLNLGCGSNFHSHWTNLDLVPQSTQVHQADLSRGIPYGDLSARVVYHSHVLEHLSPPDAERLIAECFRVLEPGGILRVAVPDLEQIAGQYLETIYRAWQDPTEHSLANHRWMQLELMDQIVRQQSGGEMGKFMVDPNISNADFVEERLGFEFHRAVHPEVSESETYREKKPASRSWIQKLKRKFIRLFFGKQFLSQLDEIRFRQSGEIHQWMYDRVSLRNLLDAAGFTNFQVCTATESLIEDFESYGLDSRNGRTLKPDSIFVEAIKPPVEQLAAA